VTSPVRPAAISSGTPRGMGQPCFPRRP
jgi:hypothetical protein